MSDLLPLQHNMTPQEYLAELDNVQAQPKVLDNRLPLFTVRGMIQRERQTRYGLKVYLKLQYDSLRQAIEASDESAAASIIAGFEGSFDDFVEMQITDKPILFTCVDHKAEHTAIGIIKHSANPRVSWEVCSYYMYIHTLRKAKGLFMSHPK